ncbi:metallophosphoesterase [Cellulophaga sp. Hel_I_12]|uniref:metallophosphoesterase family protein n=1 Tax=Cellulophaga sp. Hel_I_12 TaxID=1249972 RepID=UPI00069052B6|nr:metallophosphoesterase family protein [Cellulophaga sp. Hel_I_12]
MDKKKSYLGALEGKVLVFGGVYSNLQALEALLTIAQENNIAADHCICTGDIVGYCAQPEETVQLFKTWGAHSIAGNVEVQLVEGAEDCGCDFTEGSRCDGFSKLWYPYAQSRLSKDAINYMEGLPNHVAFDYVGKKVAVIHGAVENISEFIFETSSVETKLESFKDLDAEVILAGHCGLPFSQEIDKKLWINPGVIGMPANDGTSRVWYVLLEDVDGQLKYTHQYLEYDFQKAYQLMKSNHLPMEYAETLVSGLWDNMEILPEAERSLAGIPYTFNKESITINLK